MTNKLLYPVAEALQLLSIGRTKFYAEVKRGRITLVKSGGKTLVPGTVLEAYAATLIAEAEASRAKAAA
jgi:excisionase family DNA binding protein